MSEAQTTTDHDEIKAWAQARGGEPAVVQDTVNDGQKSAVLRIRFREDEDTLEPVFWDRFFELFEENKLAALLQDETSDGSQSRFVKFVSR